MIERRTIEAIRDRYGDVASWAVWAPEGAKPKSNISDLSVLDPKHNPQLTHILRTNVVLLGLNISRTMSERPFGNFHDPRPQATDWKLRRVLLDSPWWGGYMTDVIKGFKEPLSQKVMKYLENNQDFERQQIQSLREELAFIGCKAPVLVALGQAAREILLRNFQDEFRIVGVPHYAARMSLSEYQGRIRDAMADSGFL